MNLEELAAELISFMQDAYPGVLAEKYTINEKPEQLQCIGSNC